MPRLKAKHYAKGVLMRLRRVRAKTNRPGLPSLVVFRSNKYIYAQVVGADGKTLAGLSGNDPVKVGKTIAQKAKKKGVSRIVFDRGGYKYHGQVKSLAEAAREGGLVF